MAKKEPQLVGVPKSYVKHSIIGFVVGFVIIFLGTIIPGIGAIGIPSLPASIANTSSRFILIVLLASIFETFFFFDIVISFVHNKLKIPFWLSAIIISAFFSFFHVRVYESLVANQGSFITAGVMGLVFSYLRKYTKSNISGITLHMLLNFYIGFFRLSVIVALGLSLIL